MEPPEVLRRVANGRIPLSFDMHESEVTSLHRPPPFYIMAPRLSYLPLVSRSARESFGEAAPDVGESGVWFEHEGKPLRWNIPIGVLFDFHRKSSPKNIDPEDLPFRITIRFQGFPKTNLLPCAGEVDVENAFFNSMKQALCLRYGSAKRLMDMPKSNQENLWDGIVFGKFEKYWQSCQALLASDQETPPRVQIPVRVLVKGGKSDAEETTARVLQASVPYKREDLTLKEAIDIVLKSSKREDVHLEEGKVRIYIQGTEPPLDAPVREVCDEMCAHDLFLYIVVQVISA